jgi:ABC-type Fe3+ transport system permease subunit
MWICSRCHETVEETFDVCWNCGTAMDGTVAPNFQREADGLSSPPQADAESHARREQDAATKLETAASTNGPWGPRWLLALVWALWVAFWAALFASCGGGGIAYLLVRRPAGAASYYGDIAEFFYVLGTAIVSAAIIGVAVFILVLRSEMNSRQQKRRTTR